MAGVGTDVEPDVDLDAYVERIGYRGPLRPDRDVLTALHRAHALAIPFENLDIMLGRPIRLGLDALQDKLVRNRRGGYCYENNLLFAAVLARIGFRVTTLSARVRYRARGVPARTHMLMAVDLPSGTQIADVGFGAEGLFQPFALCSGEHTQGAWRYRLVEENGWWVLQSRRADAWEDLYAFTLEPQYLVDFEVASHYMSTHPSSRFVRTLTAQRLAPDVRYALRDRELIIDRGPDDVTVQPVPDDDALLEILAQRFDLAFPAGTRFAIPGTSGP